VCLPTFIGLAFTGFCAEGSPSTFLITDVAKMGFVFLLDKIEIIRNILTKMGFVFLLGKIKIIRYILSKMGFVFLLGKIIRYFLA
jgi:hypothetical protein